MKLKKPSTKTFRHVTEGRKWEIMVDWYRLIGEKKRCPYGGRKKVLLDHNIDTSTLTRIIQQHESERHKVGEISMKPKAYGKPSNNTLKCKDRLVNSATKIQVVQGNHFISSRRLTALVMRDTKISVDHKTMSKLRMTYFERHRRIIEPKFTENHRFQRIRWVCNEVDVAHRQFHNFFNTVHIDEAWIVQDKDGQLFWWPNGVPLPDGPKHHSKRHIKKVMVLVALAQPRLEYDFDGLVGIYFFTQTHTFVRNSKYHEKGKTKLVCRAVDADAFREVVLERLVPDIKKKMPWCKGLICFAKSIRRHPTLVKQK